MEGEVEVVQMKKHIFTNCSNRMTGNFCKNSVPQLIKAKGTATRNAV
jgi:hypothetical protein